MRARTGRTIAEKADALALADEVGAEEAARRLGVPAGSIRRWRHEGLTGTDVEPSDPSLPWPARREQMIPRLAAAAEEALAAARQAVAGGKLRDARDAFVGLGIVLDKLQLLSGLATSRSEALVARVDADPAVRAEIAQLRAELGYDAIDVEAVEDAG